MNIFSCMSVPVMMKSEAGHSGRICAFTVFAAGFVSFLLLAPGLSCAGENVPLPLQKPAFHYSPASDQAKIIKYSLDDFAKGPLGLKIPVPKRRPFASANAPLSEETAARYAKIFELQAAGDMEAADKEIAQLDDLRLRGYILHQRYMHPRAYISSFEELASWMTLYADYPQADKIYNLALRKMPEGFSGHITKPEAARVIAHVHDPMVYAGMTYRPAKARGKAEEERAAAFKKSIGQLVLRGSLTKAYEKLKHDKESALLDNAEQDILRAMIAAGYLYDGKTAQAYSLAAASVERSDVAVPQAGWVAGLTAWKRGDYERAAGFFEVTALSPYASGWMASGGAYWAARAHARTGDKKAARTWLMRGMEYPRTFYGLLATRALDEKFDFNWTLPSFTDAHRQALEAIPAGRRAVALVAAGQIQLAEAELLQLHPGNDEGLSEALFAYAGYADLPSLGMRLANAISGPQGQTYDAALYPLGPWEPRDGFKIDPALIYAIMRQESRFDPLAESISGAKGLMQIMPRTASYVAGAAKAQALAHPETNLEIGQKYIETLLAGRFVQGDLTALLVAYNAGPGNLARWKKGWVVEDPLLFIELIPSKETRIYVERVLANYWIYQMREGRPTPTLEALAAGRTARYADSGYLASYKVASKQ